MALQQTVNISDVIKVNADGTLGQFTVSYDSTDSVTGDPVLSSTNLGSGLYFDSTQLDLIGIPYIYTTGLKIPNPGSSTFPGDSRPDESNQDGNDTTDQLFLATWNDPSNWQNNNSSFPLYTAIFEITPGVDNPTFNFVAVPSNGAEPVKTIVPASFTTVTNEIPTVTAKEFIIPRADIPANHGFFTSVTVADADDAINTLTVKILNGNFDTDGDNNLAFAPALSFVNGTWNLVVNDKDDLTPQTVTTFDLTVEATDPLQESSTGVVSVTITDPPINEAPVIADKNFGTILGNEITKYSKLANGDTFTTVNVTDADNNIDTVSIISGNVDADGDGNLPFAEALTFANGTWNIVVNDADDLNFANSQGYTLDIQATDTEGASDTGTVTFAITDKFQRLNVTPETLRIKSDGTTLDFTVEYESSDPTVGSFGAGLFFDSTALDLIPLQQADILGTNRTFPNTFPADSRADESNNDQDATTDQVLLTAWSDGTQNWPGTTPIDLYKVTFDVAQGFSGSTPINFKVSPANGFVADVPRFDVTVNSVPVVTGNTFTIAENTANGTEVGVLSITDADDDNLTITENSEAFNVELIDGEYKVVVANSSLLDYETTKKFDFIVTATDSIGESSTGNVTVNLTDVNEVPTNTAPVVTDSTVNIDENSTNNTFVGNINVTDDKDLSNLSVVINGGNTDVDGDGQGAFRVQFNNGAWEVVVNDQGDLNYEAKSKFDLSLTATDKEGLSDSGLFTVNLNDVNEAPFFTTPTYKFNVYEVSANDTVVGKVSATDPEGQALTYSIVGGNDDKNGNGQAAFKIDNDGNITVNDFGDILTNSVSPEYNLVISAQDSLGAESINTTNVEVDVKNSGIYNLNAGQRLEVSGIEAHSSLYNLVTFYRVDDLTGTIDGVAPGQSGYVAKALARAEQDVLVRGQGENNNTIEGNGASFTSASGGLYAPMLLANGGNLNDVNDFLEINRSNTIGDDIRKISAYFTFGAANAKNDGDVSSGHFRSSGDTLFVEDLHSNHRSSGEPNNNGIPDYNDISFKVSVI